MLHVSERIRDLAYRLWEQDGCPAGRELEHWLEAERRLSAEQVAAPKTAPKKSRKAKK
jgi:hypothetical protein